MTTASETVMARVTRSFGFDPAESQHHFVVFIPRGLKQDITITEQFTWHNGPHAIADADATGGLLRGSLVRSKWDAIADAVRAAFNARLKQMGRRAGSWKTGPNFVRRELGKELVLLVWAIEEADPGLIPAALTNWQGLVPEERWWLYTQTAAATGHGLLDRGRGWRKAVRFALTENPVGPAARDKAPVPEYFRQAAQREAQRELFGNGEW